MKCSIEDLGKAFDAGASWATGNHKDFHQIHPNKKEFLMKMHTSEYYMTQRLLGITDYARSMGRNCYIEGSKVCIEIEKQTPNGATYTITESVSTLAEAKSIIQDE